ncbi:DsbA family oxidoreductase [Flavobacterium crassostreae]|uniref:Disulfide bond formation protein DsbA n=1 Tax=Flavobacterium crassostreae TaxID=1763534 RepID=A0A1B9DX81_9FLAO|nr:DsbA family oxidoreductase [Flavobacterium crassostreae]OCB74294.1 disulfide bond formation protein DsbA [Flavobacterium crassostreae]
MATKLKIQIWSDVMCPYCYIGKRRIEAALAQFEHRDNVEIEWKSFQLDANFIASAEDSIVEHLAEKYRKDVHWAQEMMQSMTQNAKSAGLDFRLEKAIMANSFNAHRLLHLAKKYQLSNTMEEILFKAYLTDGKNVNDLVTLKELALQVGLPEQEVDAVLETDAYAKEVHADLEMAQNIGVKGVPFFVFDSKYAVSGAQEVDTFVKTLEKVWEDGHYNIPLEDLSAQDGASCGTQGCN